MGNFCDTELFIIFRNHLVTRIVCDFFSEFERCFPSPPDNHIGVSVKTTFFLPLVGSSES